MFTTLLLVPVVSFSAVPCLGEKLGSVSTHFGHLTNISSSLSFPSLQPNLVLSVYIVSGLLLGYGAPSFDNGEMVLRIQKDGSIFTRAKCLVLNHCSPGRRHEGNPFGMIETISVADVALLCLYPSNVSLRSNSYTRARVIIKQHGGCAAHEVKSSRVFVAVGKII